MSRKVLKPAAYYQHVIKPKSSFELGRLKIGVARATAVKMMNKAFCLRQRGADKSLEYNFIDSWSKLIPERTPSRERLIKAVDISEHVNDPAVRYHHPTAHAAAAAGHENVAASPSSMGGKRRSFAAAAAPSVDSHHYAHAAPASNLSPSIRHHDVSSCLFCGC